MHQTGRRPSPELGEFLPRRSFASPGSRSPLLTPIDFTTAIVTYALAGLYLVWQRKKAADARGNRVSDFDRMGKVGAVRPSVHALRTELDETDRRLMAIDHHLSTPNEELAREIDALREEK